MALVSVIMPTYKRPAFLFSAIKSVIKQVYNDWELLIVSDGDSDAFKVVDGYSFDSRIFYIDLPRNYCDTGSTPKNVGIMLAKGKYIAYLDDDNEYLPNHLQDLVGLIRKSGVDFVYGSTEIYNRSKPDKLVSIRDIEPPNFGRIDTSELVHKKELIEKFGWWHNTDYDEDGNLTGYWGTDWDLIKRWLKGKATWKHSSEVTLKYYFKNK